MDAQVLTSSAFEFFIDREGIIERAYDPTVAPLFASENIRDNYNYTTLRSCTSPLPSP